MNHIKSVGTILLIALTSACGLGDDDDKSAKHDGQRMEQGESVSASVTGGAPAVENTAPKDEVVAVKQDGAGSAAIFGTSEGEAESGTVDAAAVVEESKEEVADAATGVKEVVEDAVDATTETASDVVEGSKKVVGDVTEASKDAAVDVVDGTKELANDAGEAASEGVDKVKAGAAAVGAVVVAAGSKAMDKASEVVTPNAEEAPAEEREVAAGADARVQAADDLILQLEEALDAAKKARASLN